ncbi:MAG TPA: DUF3617 family protein [Candidatus Acidoferrales bacterium]|nr:DUF3617 family protein [Candidatus Acidoferrales bacterium]HEV2499670.1 DUF3617 family protein [Terriglobia bacterium]
MRKAIAVAVIGLAASLGLAATVLLAQSGTTAPATPVQLTPLNARTGLWQTTTTMKYSGLPPQFAAALKPTTTYKSCLKPKDLSPNNWTTKGLGVKCSTLTVLKSTATDIDVEGKGCSVGGGMTGEGRGKFHLADTEHLTGSMDVTWSGSTPFGSGTVHSHGDYTSNWIGATCPADMN